MTDPNINHDDQDAALGRQVLYVGAYEQTSQDSEEQPVEVIGVLHWRLVLEGERVLLETNEGVRTDDIRQPFSFSTVATRYPLPGVPAGFINSEWVQYFLADERNQPIEYAPGAAA